MALLFAVAAGTLSGSYAVCMRLAAGAISPALGALIVSATALPITVAMFIGMRMIAPGMTFTVRGGTTQGPGRARGGVKPGEAEPSVA